MPAESTLSAERLREFFDVSLAIASDLSLPAVLQRTVSAACTLTGARYGALGIIVDGAIQEFVVEGAEPEWVERMPNPPQGTGLIGFLLQHPETLIVDDVEGHPTSTGFPAAHPPMHTLLGVPIRVRNRTFAKLYLADKRDGTRFGDADDRLISTLAAIASVAIENATHYEEQEEILLVRERERIARDLHDRVIQRLFATAMSLEAAARGSDDDRARIVLSRAVDDLDDTIREIRSTIFELHHAERTALSSDVAALIEELQPTLGFAPLVLAEGALDTEVVDPIREHFLAALRELLTNVGKHARASRTQITIRVTDELALRVADDGWGIATDAAMATSRGMENLRARAESCNGCFRIGPGEGGGTVAEWVVPLGV